MNFHKYLIIFSLIFLTSCKTPLVTTGRLQKELTELGEIHKTQLSLAVNEVIKSKDAQIKQI
jgi:uncharacterized ion transporter superfamily protein YfcC